MFNERLRLKKINKTYFELIYYLISFDEYNIIFNL